MAIALRAVTDADLDAIFDQMRDPESVQMAAFTAEDPNDRAAFDAHQARIRSSPDATQYAITQDGLLVGTIGVFVMEGDTEITYWLARRFWGQGIATQALALLLATVRTRPIHARAASDNLASLRVLQKAGFIPTGTDRGYANARAAEIEETILRLD
ncbi:GCN5-related N-acetyltransferase [Kribbella flavida DSM 17836]|uniref:GCN5-related N-acetyltransferase n=1 Tax=Kribbella flavida (strain DSM 17836 / JCM 10339 / NBRC 14399) TaxID=479435 RepID=D2PKZ3_KRIFD|nr:GNAT family N-acetyltransferase [Kribbella flavida]ADB32460.1 GCN5-related N-acetyltransferase [Kribbella flavida DSM 17836]